MTLNELKKSVDAYCERGRGDWKVVVELSQISIGGIASTEIAQIYEGFDWDFGKVIINTSDSIIMKTKDRDNPVEIKKDPVFSKRYLCSACGYYVRKDDKFCSSCGQKLKGYNYE